MYTSWHSESKVFSSVCNLRGILTAVIQKAQRGEFSKGHSLIGSLSLNAPIVGPAPPLSSVIGEGGLLIVLLFKFSVNSQFSAPCLILSSAAPLPINSSQQVHLLVPSLQAI